MPAHQAIGQLPGPRSYLDMAGLTEGAPADAVIDHTDPRRGLSQLAAARAVRAARSGPIPPILTMGGSPA
jgi:hypothetical protein